MILQSHPHQTIRLALIIALFVDGCNGRPQIDEASGALSAGAQVENLALNIVDREFYNCGGKLDHMSVPWPTNPPSPGVSYEGEKWYFSEYNTTPAAMQYSLVSLIREYSPEHCDHMDTTIYDEGSSSGYSPEFGLGYPFTYQYQGTCPTNRWFNNTIFDHMTGLCGEVPSGYNLDFTMAYGYPRYGNDCEVLQSFSGAQIGIKLNMAAGGAIDELWWNGRQFINDWDYGRQIQMTLNFGTTAGYDNPTEGGDKYGCPGPNVPTGWAHGSPLATVSFANNILTTTTLPLQWSPENFTGGNSTHPVRWLGTMSKAIQFDFAGKPNILQWTSTFALPNSHDHFSAELVSAWLNSEYNRFWAYDASSHSLSEMTSAVPAAGCLDPAADGRLRPPHGGVIISNTQGDYALGVYRSSSNNNFGFCRQTGSTGKYGYGHAMFNALERTSSGISSGTHSYVVYLAVGSLEIVQDQMAYLFSSGF